MNRKYILAFGLGFVLIASIGLLVIENKDTFSCDNLGIVYATPSEINSLQKLKDMGVIISIPEKDMYIANTEVFNCPNIDQYLGHLKN